MADRVVMMSQDEYDEIINGVSGLPFEVNRTVGSNGQFVRTVIEVSKSKMEQALQASDYTEVAPTDGSPINYACNVKWID